MLLPFSAVRQLLRSTQMRRCSMNCVLSISNFDLEAKADIALEKFAEALDSISTSMSKGGDEGRLLILRADVQEQTSSYGECVKTLEFALDKARKVGTATAELTERLARVREQERIQNAFPQSSGFRNHRARRTRTPRALLSLGTERWNKSAENPHALLLRRLPWNHCHPTHL